MDIQIPVCLGMKKEDFPKSGYMFELKCVCGLNLALTTLYYFNIRPLSSRQGNVAHFWHLIHFIES